MLTSTREVPSADLNCADERLSMEEVDSIITFTKADDDACDCESDMLHSTMAYTYIIYTTQANHINCEHFIELCTPILLSEDESNSEPIILSLSLLFAKKNIKLFICGCDSVPHVIVMNFEQHQKEQLYNINLNHVILTPPCSHVSIIHTQKKLLDAIQF